MNLKPYLTKRSIDWAHYEVSLCKNIPIAELENVKSFLRGKGFKFRIRYRGPRTNPLDTRYRHQRMQDCLKKFANRFSVYLT